MDIQIRKQLEQLEYIKDKLEYIEYSESLQCYVEKLNGIPTGVAAWVNGAFYGFEQAAKAKAVPGGFVSVNKKELAKVLNCVTDNWLIDTGSVEEFKKIESLVQDEIDAMFGVQEVNQ